MIVPPGALPAARAALEELGYRNASATVAVDDIGGVIHGESWLAIPAGARCPVVLDLHLHLAGTTAPADAVWEALSARSTLVEVGGRQVPSLDRAGLAMHLATHVSQHGQAYDKGRRELLRALDRWPFEVWGEAAKLADEIDATEAFAAGLRLVEPGTELAERLELPSTSGLDWELRQTERPRGRFHLQAFLHAPTAGARAHVLRRALLPDRRWIARQYPWTRDCPARLLAAYLAHIARSPAWALRAALFRLRQRRTRRS